MSGGGQSATPFYGGMDLRIGTQINDLIAIYAQPQLGFYGGNFGGVNGVGGLIGVSALADFTLSDRFFVGAGGGFAVLNNPSGPELHLRARSLMERFLKVNPEDPMPYMDGFGAAVTLAKVLPMELTHDVEQFEFTKGKLKIRGLVETTEDAQDVAKLLEGDDCLSEVKITKITQVVNSERARYMLEADVKCPLDKQPDDPKKKPSAGEQP